MIDYASITVGDLTRAGRFYEAIMMALGGPRIYRTEGAIGHRVRNTRADDGHSYVSVFAGGCDDGAPGLRHEYHPARYAAFVTDPDGSRTETVHHRGAGW